MDNLATSERDKYWRAWDLAEYREFSPGLQALSAFLPLTSPDQSVWDLGCGEGVSTDGMIDSGLEATGVDFVDVRQNDVPFIQACLWEFEERRRDWVFCVDVLEHIPTEKIEETLLHIAALGKRFFLQISTVPDSLGRKIGETLHLTVRSSVWWHAMLTTYIVPEEIRIFDGAVRIIGRARTLDDAIATVNVDNDLIIRNIKSSKELKLPRIIGNSPAHNGVAVLCGSGPSLTDPDSLSAIRDLQEKGAKVFGLGNASNILLDHGIHPHASVIVDAREGNIDFVNPRVRRHYLATQCDPGVIRKAADSGHATLYNAIVDFNVYDEGELIIGGGLTVGLTAACLVWTIGFRDIHLFGYDSSHRGSQKHAVLQAINQGEDIIVLQVGDKMFQTSPAMAKQARRFCDLVQVLATQGASVSVHGDGLLPYACRQVHMMIQEIEVTRDAA